MLSNAVDTSMFAVSGVNESPEELNINWLFSEKIINCSPIVTACFNIDIFVLEAATSIGSLSITVVTVSGKKLKYSPTLERITSSSERIPNLFLKKKMLFNCFPTKEGLGAVSKSPTVLSTHLGKVSVLANP